MVSSEFSNVNESIEASITSVSKVLLQGLQRNSSIWVMGNGGSASTADHFEIDLLSIRFTKSHLPIKVFSLAANSAVISAIANDLSYEEVFSIQLERKAQPKDIAIFISASGNSPNLLRAAEVCKRKEIQTIGLVGFDGGKLKSITDLIIHVETRMGDYAVAENKHLAVCHQLAEMIRRDIFDI
jgi:D-sedoheptulose 7-phosphate isomerase